MRLAVPTAVLLTLLTGRVSAADADAIVARYVEARGGAARLSALQSLRLTGRVVFGNGDGQLEAEWAQLQKRTGRVRSEITLQGLTSVEAHDGQEAWSLNPFRGRRDAEKRSADDAKELARDADIDGPLVSWRTKGHRVEYLGTEDVDGTLAHKLRVALKDGDTQYVYLEPDHMLEIRTETVGTVRGAERITVTDLGSYEQVGGVWIPFSIESGRKGAARSTRVTVTRAEANVPVDDALFRFPPAGTPIGRSILPGSVTATAAAAKPLAAAKPRATASAAAPTLDAGVLSGLGARNIGSAAMSGRIATVAARTDGGKTTIFVGAASGGVWKSQDGGTTFKPVFDSMPVQSIGSIALDPSQAQTVWVGTGEAWVRNSVSVGDGIYKSTDGGATWTHRGLRESERIVRVLVHPTKSDVVFACVPGKLWSDSPDRGVYKTTDGGATWSLVLPGGNLSTGCSSLSMDPQDPEVLLAGLWDFRRQGWTFRSGGDGPDAPSGSGLFRSADGGKTWTETSGGGLPGKPWGRVEVVHAPSDPAVLYALVESKQSGLYRSADWGKTWEARDRSQNMVWRPFYFGRLVVDPTNPDRLFKAGGGLSVSEDGGRSFAYSGGGGHADWHDVWIDPQNPKHVLSADDGGLWISHDGGNRWLKVQNLPISHFYHVSVDERDPYQVYGGLQDNSSWVGDSAHPGGISNSRWENLYGGDGFWALVDATDPDAVYVEAQGGYIGRVDRRTGISRTIQPLAGYGEKLRFNWNTPIHLSPTQKGTLYIAAQFLFRSRDRGDTWERISPDLTTNDPAKQKQEESGGITVDNSSAEMHTTIYSVSESPRNAAVIWVGTDDGNVQVTRDDAKTWTNVTPNLPDVPAGSWVSWVEASRFDHATAYVAIDRHTFGDLTPYVFRTTDYGHTWKRIGSPQQGLRGYVHVIREDVVQPGLLFAGTELGLWISTDAGTSWAEFKGGDFPSVAVRDLQVHPRDHDLVLATHGRGIWIVDDITPLRSLARDVLAKSAAFLPGRPIQQRLSAGGGWSEGDGTFVGPNPSSGAVITYYQRSRHLFGPLKLEILDGTGKVVDTMSPSKRRGINRAAWSMLVQPPRVPRAAGIAGSASQGPRVPPGTYTARLTKGAEVIETKLEVVLDRRAPWTVNDRREQFDAVMKAHALFGEMSALTARIDAVRGALAGKALPETDARARALREAVATLDEVKRKIVATKEGGAITGEERIREHLDTAYGALMSWEGRPAPYQVERVEVLRHELADVSAELETTLASVRPLAQELAIALP